MSSDVTEALLGLLRAKGVITANEYKAMVSEIVYGEGPEKFIKAVHCVIVSGSMAPVFRMHTDAKIVIPDLPMPSYETEDSVGCDLCAWLGEPVSIPPGEVRVIRTGWVAIMDRDTECQIRSRSGLTVKYNVTVANSPGAIESDYAPEDIKVILHNGGTEPFTVKHGDRIAQAVFAKVTRAVNAHYKNRARQGGLGSTGER